MLERLERAQARRRAGQALAKHRATPLAAVQPGADGLSQVDHIVVLMMENHSYDNYFGMLAGRGDGLPLDEDGQPTPVNIAGDGSVVSLRHFKGTVQRAAVPTQAWHASHIQWNGGANDGFVASIEQTLPGADATVAMTYWTEADLPFYYDLARTFPLATRWFSACLGPTFPNRRFLIAGTANGLIDDLPFEMVDYPAAGTIFDLLTAHGISWANYHQMSAATTAVRTVAHSGFLNELRVPGAAIAGFIPGLKRSLLSKVQATADLYPLGFFRSVRHLRSMSQFWADAGAGTLPAFSIVDPDFGKCSEENPQDIQDGEGFAAEVINAVLNGPAWPRTLLIWLYDEHGGYYDHVPPPAAPAPDDIGGRSPLQRYPVLRLLKSTSLVKRLELADAGPPAYDRLGFRVPAVIVSPYARANYVTDQVYDHTSILKLVQLKWNLPSLTRRDAAAIAPLNALDFTGPPAFLTPPVLAAPARPWRG